MFGNCKNNGGGFTMERSTGYAGLHDYNRARKKSARSFVCGGIVS